MDRNQLLVPSSLTRLVATVLIACCLVVTAQSTNAVGVPPVPSSVNGTMIKTLKHAFKKAEQQVVVLQLSAEGKLVSRSNHISKAEVAVSSHASPTAPHTAPDDDDSKTDFVILIVIGAFVGVVDVVIIAWVVRHRCSSKATFAEKALPV